MEEDGIMMTMERAIKEEFRLWKKVQVVTIKFQGAAAVWLEQTQLAKSRALKNPVHSWKKLKKLLKAHFLPKNFWRVIT